MKTIKLLFTVTTVAIVAIATAVERPKMNVAPLTPNKAVITFRNENSAQFEVSIHAANGDMVYYKMTEKPLVNYQKIFDFKNLENGYYEIKLKIKDTSVSRNFRVSNDEISFGESQLKFDPYFELKNNILKFSYLNFEKEKMDFKIYKQKEMIYKAKLGSDIAISSGYDLSKLDPGNYTIVLSSWKDEFEYEIEK